MTPMDVMGVAIATETGKAGESSGLAGTKTSELDPSSASLSSGAVELLPPRASKLTDVAVSDSPSSSPPPSSESDSSENLRLEVARARSIASGVRPRSSSSRSDESESVSWPSSSSTSPIRSSSWSASTRCSGRESSVSGVAMSDSLC